MQVKFWGTRGSIPSPGNKTIRYGGNTSCVEIRSDSGTLIILDCGTGLRHLGDSLLENNKKPIEGHILLGHTHWDHIQGLPFFKPIFIPTNQWDIYAPHEFENSLHGTLANQMKYPYFPVAFNELASKIRFHELVEGEMMIGDIHVQTFFLNHNALTLGYRLEVDGATVVYSTDHEPSSYRAAVYGELSDQDRHHIDFLSGADLVIHDAQYLSHEYKDKIGWGHSTVEYVMAVCRAAGVKKVALTHHDPMRDDAAIDQIVKDLQETNQDPKLEVFAAAEGQFIDLKYDLRLIKKKAKKISAFARHHLAVKEKTVLLGVSDPALTKTLLEAVKADNIETIHKKDEASILATVQKELPSLIVLEQNLPGISGIELCNKIRQLDHHFATHIPIIIITDKEETIHFPEGKSANGWLITPFSVVYARTVIHKWLLKTHPHLNIKKL